MIKSRILSFLGIVSIIALLIGATNKLTIDQQRLNSTMSGVSLVGSVPIGGMVAVTPNTHANAWQPPADCSTIKDGFMRTSTAAGVACTVPACSDCIIPAGTTLPNMYQKYARGGGTSGSTGGANTQASNVAVGNHTALALSNHTALSLNNHTALSLNAHAITQPAFNIPGHYHGMSTGSTLSASTSNSPHYHNLKVTGSGDNYTMWHRIGNYNSASSDSVTETGFSATQTDGSHSHVISGSLGLVTGGSNGDSAFSATRTTDVALTNNHSFSQNIDAHSFSQNITAHSFSQNIDGHSVTNNVVNNEPSYIEVVWVIRVK